MIRPIALASKTATNAATGVDNSMVNMPVSKYCVLGCQFNVCSPVKLHVVKKIPLLTKRDNKVEYDKVVTQAMKAELKEYVPKCFRCQRTSLELFSDGRKRSVSLKIVDLETTTICM